MGSSYPLACCVKGGARSETKKLYQDRLVTIASQNCILILLELWCLAIPVVFFGDFVFCCECWKRDKRNYWTGSNECRNNMTEQIKNYIRCLLETFIELVRAYHGEISLHSTPFPTSHCCRLGLGQMSMRCL